MEQTSDRTGKERKKEQQRRGTQALSPRPASHIR
jgi:hypothetical protein